jgi:hypothetical protein
MVFFVTEHHLTMGSEAQTVGLFHVFSCKERIPHGKPKESALYFRAYYLVHYQVFAIHEDKTTLCWTNETFKAGTLACLPQLRKNMLVRVSDCRCVRKWSRFG